VIMAIDQGRISVVQPRDACGARLSLVSISLIVTLKDRGRLLSNVKIARCKCAFGCGPTVLALSHKVVGLKWGLIEFKRSLSDE
jgi:hypothetical protein